MHILMLTSEWPSPELPHAAPFIVRQVEFLRRAGVNVDVFHFRGAKNPLNYLKAWLEVRARLRSHHFDLIHAQWGQSALLALPKSIPLVITFRGSDVEGIVDSNKRLLWQGYLLRSFSHFVARLADQAMVVSTQLIKKLPKREYHVIPSGLDLELFHPMNQTEVRNTLRLSLDGKIVLFGGDPHRSEKRFPLAQSSIEMAKKNIPSLKFVIPQGVSHSLMPLYLNSTDVMLLTSAYEGSPNVVKEALACNLPVVSTDVGDVRERIGGIEGCEVCADDCPETIAAALERTLSRGQRINGRQAVLELDEKLMTQKVIQVYHRAIQGKKQT